MRLDVSCVFQKHDGKWRHCYVFHGGPHNAEATQKAQILALSSLLASFPVCLCLSSSSSLSTYNLKSFRSLFFLGFFPRRRRFTANVSTADTNPPTPPTLPLPPPPLPRLRSPPQLLLTAHLMLKWLIFHGRGSSPPWKIEIIWVPVLERKQTVCFVMPPQHVASERLESESKT